MSTNDAHGVGSSLIKQARLRTKRGDLGVLPVIIGLVLIWTVFAVLNHRFLSAENLSNLAVQMVPVATMAVGIVLVLLLGEIDLSAGSVSGLCAAVLVVVHVKHSLPPVVGIVAALVVAALIGLFQGTVIERLRIPSFVVTLAGLIGWQGAQLWVLGRDGTINLSFNGFISKLSGTFLPWAVGLGLACIVPLMLGISAIRADRERRRRSLPSTGPLELLAKPVAIGVVLLAVAVVLNSWRGVPLTIVIFGVIVAVVDYVLLRTRAGRHVYATGGNIEAARRSGIDVRRLRTIVFMCASMLAAAGGILAASRLSAVNQSTGASDTLLSAIASAVIGGTSLFGGKGRATSALLGALVIMSIANGMNLLNLSSSIKFMITGAVLLIAAIVDSFAQRQRTRQR